MDTSRHRVNASNELHSIQMLMFPRCIAHLWVRRSQLHTGRVKASAVFAGVSSSTTDAASGPSATPSSKYNTAPPSGRAKKREPVSFAGLPSAGVSSPSRSWNLLCSPELFCPPELLPALVAFDWASGRSSGCDDNDVIDSGKNSIV